MELGATDEFEVHDATFDVIEVFKVIRWRRICFPQHDFVVCTTTFIATRPFGIRYKAGPFGRSIRDIINSFLFSSFTHTHTALDTSATFAYRLRPRLLILQPKTSATLSSHPI